MYGWMSGVIFEFYVVEINIFLPVNTNLRGLSPKMDLAFEDLHGQL
jgi:hypothetical protein